MHILDLKAKVVSAEELISRLGDLDAEKVETVAQVDTYFKVRGGKLKLRDHGGKGQVIFYKRERLKGPRRSEVLKVGIDDILEARRLFKALFPVEVEVRKVRRIYKLEGARVHIDIVEGLGEFLELEKKVAGQLKNIRKSMAAFERITKRLGVRESDIQEGSYSDLLAKKGGDR